MAVPAPRTASPWRVRVTATTATISGPGLRATEEGAFSLQAKDARRLLEALPGSPVRTCPTYRLERSPENRLEFRPAGIPFGRAVPVVEVVLPRAAAAALLGGLRGFVAAAPQPAAAAPRQRDASRQGHRPRGSGRLEKAGSGREEPVCPRRGCTRAPHDPLSGLCRRHYGQNRQYIRFVSAGAFGSGR